MNVYLKMSDDAFVYLFILISYAEDKDEINRRQIRGSLFIIFTCVSFRLFRTENKILSRYSKADPG